MKTAIRRTVYALTGAGVLAAGLVPLAGASASHNPVTTASTIISNRYDGGGGGNWAYDSFTRKLTITYLGKSADAAHASAPYEFTARLSDRGTFKDIPEALTPNQGLHPGKALRATQVGGPMSGYGQFGVFYADHKPHAGLVPSALAGRKLNSHYPSATWPELAFPAGTTFSGVTEDGFGYHYTVAVNGKPIGQHWDDTSSNGAGQLPGDGDIRGLR